MTKVIKGEFETLETLKINDVSLTCDTSLEFFHNEFNRLSNMDDDLFTYKVEIAGIANIPRDLNIDDDSEQQMSQEFDNDMDYDPSDLREDDEVGLTDEESSDFDDEGKVARIFKIEINVFDFETPLCRTFKEFTYLLQIDPDVLTKDIEGFKTYEEYKDDWIYEWTKDMPWVHEKPLTYTGVGNVRKTLEIQTMIVIKGNMRMIKMMKKDVNYLMMQLNNYRFALFNEYKQRCMPSIPRSLSRDGQRMDGNKSRMKKLKEKF
nr:hypothetical protein [Tanacetum cinerariifolium]